MPTAPPTVNTPAAASPSPAIGNTTSLSVLGASTDGESTLTYTWSFVSGPAGVGFSINGTNASKNTVATFTLAGNYHLLVTIEDTHSQTVTSPVVVTVSQTFTNITVTPLTLVAIIGTTTTFTAIANDQFGNPLVSQPSFTWTASSGGPINGSGAFTATILGGPFNINATAGGHIGIANVTVIGDPTALPPPILWDKGTLANGVIIHVLNPAHFGLNQSLIETLLKPLLPAHVKVFFEFDE